MRGLLVVSLAAAAGCGFSTRSDDFECSGPSDCDPGRVCVEGWCVVGDLPDADPNAPDSDPNAPDADPNTPDADPNTPDAATPGCGDGTCVAGEDDQNCAADCATCAACAGGSCTEDCGGSGATCNLSCSGTGCTCGFDCDQAADCNVTCTGDVDCTTSCFQGVCTEAQCNDGARCQIRCHGGGGACTFATCTGGSGAMSCGGSIIVCNKPCP